MAAEKGPFDSVNRRKYTVGPIEVTMRSESKSSGCGCAGDKTIERMSESKVSTKEMVFVAEEENQSSHVPPWDEENSDIEMVNTIIDRLTPILVSALASMRRPTTPPGFSPPPPVDFAEGTSAGEAPFAPSVDDVAAADKAAGDVL